VNYKQKDVLVRAEKLIKIFGYSEERIVTWMIKNFESKRFNRASAKEVYRMFRLGYKLDMVEQEIDAFLMKQRERAVSEKTYKQVDFLTQVKTQNLLKEPKKHQ